MSEKRFLNFIFVEGVLLTILGLCVLILPKLTSLTFGVMLASAFIAYGLYKVTTSIINRHYLLNTLWCIFLGIYILTVGILLLMIPKISLLWLIALTGVYFLLESVSTIAFMAHVKNVFNFIGCKWFTAFVLFSVGLIIVLGLPLMSFWAVAILSGMALTIKGLSKITLSLANKNNFSI